MQQMPLSAPYNDGVPMTADTCSMLLTTSTKSWHVADVHPNQSRRFNSADAQIWRALDPYSLCTPVVASTALSPEHTMSI
jgi:hypothetical protein